MSGEVDLAVSVAYCPLVAHDYTYLAGAKELLIVSPERGRPAWIRLTAAQVLRMRTDGKQFDLDVLQFGTGLQTRQVGPDELTSWHAPPKPFGSFFCLVNPSQCAVEQIFFHAWSGGVGFSEIQQVDISYHRCVCSKCFEFNTRFNQRHEQDCKACASGLEDTSAAHRLNWYRERRRDSGGWLKYDE